MTTVDEVAESARSVQPQDEHRLRADPATVDEAVREAAEFGPYFEVARFGEDEVDPRTLVPVDALYRDSAVLDRAVDGVAERMGVVERRVAASTLHISHAARLWSMTLGAYASAGVVPAPESLSQRWDERVPGAFVMQRPGGWRPADASSPTIVADVLIRVVVDEHLRPLQAALRTGMRLPEGLMWGNAASALVGAMQVIESARGDRELRGPVGAVLSEDPLASWLDYGTDRAGLLVPGSTRRRSCCLYYRSPTGGTCGDCPLEGSHAAGRGAARRPLG